MFNAIKDAPTDVLCEAAKTLQAAHDFVENHDFDICKYGNEEGAVQCCFIGSVRQAAGEHEIHEYEASEKESSALALVALDLVVVEKGADPSDGSAHLDGSARYRAEGETVVGTIAEHWGFRAIGQRYDGLNPQNSWENPISKNEQKPFALDIYRGALRLMHTELMSRDDAPVEVPA